MLCKKPIYVPASGGIVPCGQCRHCRINKRRRKVARCALEARCNSGDALFVTLTYKDDFLPETIFDPRTGEVLYSHPRGCLDKHAIQKFFKRVLRAFPPRSIRYFYCGEYGEEKERPHYHMVIWGIPWKSRDIIFRSWTDTFTGELLCNPDRLQIEVPRSNSDVANYCCSYIMKARTNGENESVKQWLDGRPPEFFHSSKGLGLAAVSGIAATLHNSVDVPREFLLEGKVYPMDRYLQEKILDVLPQGSQIREARLSAFQKEMSDLYSRARPTAKIERLLGIEQDERVYAASLVKQFVSEKAVEMDLVDKRLDFFERKN